MKRMSFSVICFLICIYACTDNKSVVEDLSLDDVSSLLEKDSLYKSIISEVELKRKLIEDDKVKLSKYQRLTFKDYLKFKKIFKDSLYIKEIADLSEIEFHRQMDSLFIIYKSEIDSLVQFYKEYSVVADPSKYFSVEFIEIEKEYYSYGNGVKEINVRFKISPLKGAIQGGSFSYSVIPKVTEKETASGACRFSSYTSRPSKYYWEAPYDVEREFKNLSTSEIKKNYNFEYTILSARQKGKTYKILDIYEIPIDFRIVVDKDTINYFQYANILKSHYKIEVKLQYEIFNEIINAEKKKNNALAFDFESLSLPIDKQKELQDKMKDIFKNIVKN